LETFFDYISTKFSEKNLHKTMKLLEWKVRSSIPGAVGVNTELLKSRRIPVFQRNCVIQQMKNEDDSIHFFL